MRIALTATAEMLITQQLIMKTLKLAIVTAILALGFNVANAQVRVGLHIGTPPPRRVVVVEHPAHYHREVIVERGYPRYHHGYGYRRHYYRHGYRRW